MAQRPTWDEYFMKMADMVGERGTCDRGRSGCVIVIDKRVVVTGYVGSPPGQPHCDDAGHLMQEVTDDNGNKSMHCVRTIHAEENAILQAAKFGTPLKNSVIYCKMTPCFRCARMIISVGAGRVLAKKRYRADQLSIELFKAAGVQFDVLENEVEEYKNQ